METMTIEAPSRTGSSARAEVEKLYADLGKAKSDLADLSAKSARTGLNQQATLEHDGFTEQEVADELGRLQNLKNVFSARIARKEKAVAKLDNDLEAAVESLIKELRAQVHEELERRRAILVERVVEALELPADHTLEMELNLLIGFSPLIRAIQDCEPRNYGQLEWGGGKVSLGQKVTETLERADRLETLMKEQI
jgi:hypothetical protein